MPVPASAAEIGPPQLEPPSSWPRQKLEMTDNGTALAVDSWGDLVSCLPSENSRRDVVVKGAVSRLNLDSSRSLKFFAPPQPPLCYLGARLGAPVPAQLFPCANTRLIDAGRSFEGFARTDPKFQANLFCIVLINVFLLVQYSDGVENNATQHQTNRRLDPSRSKTNRDASNNRYKGKRQAEDGDMPLTSKKQKTRGRVKGNRLLACPCYKYNPIRYLYCLHTNHLTETSYVVSHLLRCAMHPAQPIHCPTCGEVFETQDAADQHIVLRSCDRREFHHEGLKADQRNALRQIPKNLNQVERWFRIWDIVYPNSPRPASPYVDELIPEVAGIVRRALSASDNEPAILFVTEQLRRLSVQDSLGILNLVSTVISLVLAPDHINSVLPIRNGNLSYLASDSLAPTPPAAASAPQAALVDDSDPLLPMEPPQQPSWSVRARSVIATDGASSPLPYTASVSADSRDLTRFTSFDDLFYMDFPAHTEATSAFDDSEKADDERIGDDPDHNRL